MKLQKLPITSLQLLKVNRTPASEKEWANNLKSLGIKNSCHIRIATERALIGGLFENGFNPELVILSDDAGQFNILLHALCWVHAERTIHKIIPFYEKQRSTLKSIRDNIWKLYDELKLYKEKPTKKSKIYLEKRFDDIF